MHETDAGRYVPAAHDAMERFGLEGGALEPVAVSENVTFRVESRKGPAFALRLHRPGYHTLEELNSERVWLASLAAAGISVPEPVPSRHGEFYVPVRVSPVEQRFAGVSRWREGMIIADLSTDTHAAVPVADHAAQLGSLMARMHDAASGWWAPPGFVRQRLDADGLLGPMPFWGRFWEVPELTAAQRNALRGARSRLHGSLVAYGDRGPTFSMIHADLHLSNLLVDPTGRITVIDFDDAGFGWHQYDMAVALSHISAAPDAPAATRAFLDAYRAVRTISDDDLAWLPVFELIRGMALIGWKGQRPEVRWPPGRFERLVERVVGQLDSVEVPG